MFCSELEQRVSKLSVKDSSSTSVGVSIPILLISKILNFNSYIL